MTETSNANSRSFRRETRRVVNEIPQELRSPDDEAAWFTTYPAQNSR